MNAEHNLKNCSARHMEPWEKLHGYAASYTLWIFSSETRLEWAENSTQKSTFRDCSLLSWLYKFDAAFRSTWYSGPLNL